MSGSEHIDFEQRLAAFNYNAGSFSTFPTIKRAIERHAPAALTALYRHIANTVQIRGLFASPARMDHARDKQMEHWRKLFSGPLNDDYAASSTHIGLVHARIGLAPTWYISGYARMLEHVLPKLILGRLLWPFGAARRARAANALVKASLIDMDIALSAYFEAEQAGRRAVIERCGAVFDRMAKGDLTASLDGLPTEYQALTDSFEAMRAQMCATLGVVTQSGEQIRVGSGDIRQASDDLSDRTRQQAASLEETAAAMQQITSTVRQTADGATRANRIVGEARQEAEESGQIVRRAVEAMGGIERASAEISEIITVIDGISFQTNLLALNAGVEADRPNRDEAAAAPDARELAKQLLAQRMARFDHFPAELFHEPAWDMLLALFVAHEERRTLNVKALVGTAHTPVTTSQRWIDHLHKLKLVDRVIDPHDRRRMEVSLSDTGQTAVRAYLRRLGAA